MPHLISYLKIPSCFAGPCMNIQSVISVQSESNHCQHCIELRHERYAQCLFEKATLFFVRPPADHNDISQQNFSRRFNTTIFRNKISPCGSPQRYFTTKSLLVVDTNNISQQNCMKGLSKITPKIDTKCQYMSLNGPDMVPKVTNMVSKVINMVPK
jgi:hypothetical protein